MQKPPTNSNLPSASTAQQQNISINISYNLNTTKLPKSMLGPKKASSKTKKTIKEPIQGIGNDFFNAFGSLNQVKRVKKQNVLKRSNQPKPQKLTQPKPQKSTQLKPQPIVPKKPLLKKKKPTTKQLLMTQPQQHLTQYYNPLANNSKHFLKRNIQSPDIFGKGEFGDRKKMKTEVSCYQQINEVSSFKKSKKSVGNSREMLARDKKLSVKDNVRKELTGKVSRSKKGSAVGIKQKRLLTQQPQSRQKRILTQQNQYPSSYNQPITSTHNKSCMLYSTKKPITPLLQPNLIETASHLISHPTPSHAPNPKKRAQSADSFTKTGKQIVSRLLNLSIISSQQLGSSQLITSDRLRSGRGNLVRNNVRKGVRVDQLQGWGLSSGSRNEKYRERQCEKELVGSGDGRSDKGRVEQEQQRSIQPGNALRQYLNSIDLRIIKNIQQDTAQVLSTKPINNIIFPIPNPPNSKPIKPLPIPQETDVISFYSKLFTNALQNKHLLQIQKQKYLESQQDNDILLEDDVILPKVKKEKFVVDVREFLNSSGDEDGIEANSGAKDDSDDDGQASSQVKQQDNDSDNNQIYSFVPNRTTPNTNTTKLNFKHYKQLITKPSTDHSINNINPINNSNPINPTTIAPIPSQWQNIHELISLKISGQDKGQEEVMEQLIKHSSMSEKWVQEQQVGEVTRAKGRSEADDTIPPTNKTSTTKTTPTITTIINTHQQYPHHLNPSHNNPFSSSNTNNLHSPTSKSQDGHLSGEQQYDSKKYSVVDDLVIETTVGYGKGGQGKEMGESYGKEDKGEGKKDRNSAEQQQEEEDEEEVSCEERQDAVTNDNRWVTSCPSWPNNQTITSNTNTIYNNLQQTQPLQSNPTTITHNYLQCELTQFTINNNPSNITKTLTNQPNTNPYTSNILKLNEVLNQIQSKPDPPETHFHMTINGQSTQQQITLKLTPSTESHCQQHISPNPFTELRKKRLTHIVEDIILELIKQFAKDISHILKRSSTQKQQHAAGQESLSPYRESSEEFGVFEKNEDQFELVHKRNQQQQVKKSNFMGKCFGIDTSFASVQTYLKQFKCHLLSSQPLKKQILKNINKDIGPNSLQILSYLRPQYQPQPMQPTHLPEPTSDDQDEDGLFVVPSDAFSEFQNILEQQLEERNKLLEPEKQVVLTMKQKRNMNFWHRGIYESWNEFLDCERPYGINGKPYEWVTEGKHFRSIRLEDIENKLQKSIDRLLQSISLPSGIIYDKYDIPQMYLQLNQQQKMILNEERLSRMLAIELFQSEETWINYNDEMAELLVELSRMIEERIFFQLTAEVKRTLRRRRLVEGNGAMSNQVLLDGDQMELGQADDSTQNNDDGYLRQ